MEEKKIILMRILFPCAPGNTQLITEKKTSPVVLLIIPVFNELLLKERKH